MRYVSTITVTIDVPDGAIDDHTLGSIEHDLLEAVEDTTWYVGNGQYTHVDTTQEVEDWSSESVVFNCTQCGTEIHPASDVVERAVSATVEAFGEPVCERCMHSTDWHRGCDVGDEPTTCPYCSSVLATHDHEGANR
jgi:hypothetical protein